MRLCTYRVGSAPPKLGLVFNDTVIDVAASGALAGVDGVDLGADLKSVLPNPSAIEALRALERSAQAREFIGSTHAIADVAFLPPLLLPGKILCVAANYKAHIEETGVITYVEKSAANPWLFLKPNTALTGHKTPILLPRFTTKVDWELELAVVIGRRGRYIPRARAMDYVSGYTIVNDVSAREVAANAAREDRERDKFHDWLHGKWFDSFCPMGPFFVSRDEIPDPHNLRLRLSLNGEVMQDASTGQMIFPIPELIEYASVFTSLEPGDVLCTGTPSGVGKGRGRFLRSGDVLSSEIDGLGILVNSVVQEQEFLSKSEVEARHDVAAALLGAVSESD